MPRPGPISAAGSIDFPQRASETHSTLQLALSAGTNAFAQNYYLATAAITIDSVNFQNRLREGGVVKTSLSKAADRVEVVIENADLVFGVELSSLAEQLYGSEAKYGRYFRDLGSGLTSHKVFITGVVTGVAISETAIKITLLSDAYASVSVGAARRVARACQWGFRDPDTCGYSGAELVCNFLIDDSGGCEGRHGTPLKRAKFGGFVYIEPKASVQSGVSQTAPAANQLIKTSTSTYLQRTAIEFVGASVTDDPTNDRTKVTVSGSSASPDWIDVMIDYGATGNGTTNDTTAIQNAINAAQTGPKRTVYFPTGTYLVTGLTVAGQVRLLGNSDKATTIKSTSNAVIVDMSGDGNSRGGQIEGLRILGSTGAGSSQIGLKVSDATYAFLFKILNVTIEDCGGNGLYVGKAFSSSFRNIFITNCENYPLLYNAQFMPGNLFDQVYVGNVRANAPVGFRIKAGDFYARNCNGINNAVAGSKWAVLGTKTGVDGDSSDIAAYAHWTDCNFESWTSKGIEHLYNSFSSWDGKCSFAAHSVTTLLNGAINNSVTTITVDDTTYFPSSGKFKVDSEVISYTGKTSTTFTGCTRGAESTSAASHADNATVTHKSIRPVEYDVDTSLNPAYFKRGKMATSVEFGDGPETNYEFDSAVISNSIPPLEIEGRGPAVAPSNGTPGLSTYYDTGNSKVEALPRVDGMVKRFTVTASRTFNRPGVKYIEVNHSAPCTVTLPWPGWYRTQEEIIVKDVSSGGAATNNITISADAGGTVNGGSYTIATNGLSVRLMPNESGTDWRVVGVSVNGVPITGTSSTDYLPVWTGPNALGSSYLWKYAPGGSNYTVSVEHFIFQTDNAKDIGTTNDNRPRNIYVGTNVKGPLIELTERTAPSTPSANSIYFYAKDKSGVSTLYYKKDDGTEVEIGSGGGSPGGSNKQVQFNNSSAFGGATGFEYQSGSSPNVTVQAQSSTHVPLVAKGAASQSANLQEWKDSTDTIKSYMTPSGGVGFGGDSNFSISGTSTTFPRKLQLQNVNSGTAFRVELESEGTGYQIREGGKFQIHARYGVKIVGSRNSTSAPSFETGASSDPALHLENGNTGSIPLRVNAMNGTTVDVVDIQSNGTTVIKANKNGGFTPRQLIGGDDGTGPSYSSGTGAGTSPTVSLDGTDVAGYIGLTTGSSPAASAKILDITLANVFPAYPVVILQPANAATAALSGNQLPFVSDADGTTSKFQIKSGSTGLAASTLYEWYYHVIGR